MDIRSTLNVSARQRSKVLTIDARSRPPRRDSCYPGGA